MRDFSDKSRELDELRALSATAAWKDRILPKLEKLRDTHMEGGLARNSTPEKRAEHVEAWHELRDLIAYVPERIAALTKEIAAREQSESISGPLPSALADPQ